MNQRNQRMADSVHRELATLIAAEIKDPRLKALNITQVEVTPDLKFAKVFVSHPEGKAAFKAGETALAKASGFFRSQLAEVLNTYSVPALKFVFDDSVERGANLSALIDKAVAEDKTHPST